MYTTCLNSVKTLLGKLFFRMNLKGIGAKIKRTSRRLMHMISVGGQLQNVKQFECTQVVSCQIDDCHPVGKNYNVDNLSAIHWEWLNES